MCQYTEEWWTFNSRGVFYNYVLTHFNVSNPTFLFNMAVSNQIEIIIPYNFKNKKKVKIVF